MEYYLPKARSHSVYISLLAILTGLTTVATIIIVIPLPQSTGYLNFGDALVMLSGMLLGPAGGFIAGGIGSAMGDIALGYTHFAPITLVVKGLEGLIVGLFSSRARSSKKLAAWDLVGLVLSSIAMMSGYFLAEIPLVGYEAALVELLTLNWIQVTVGSVVAAIVGPATRGLLQEYLYVSDGDIEDSTLRTEFDESLHQS